jgi:hypothetical protein
MDEGRIVPPHGSGPSEWANPQPDQRFMWGKDEVSVIAATRGGIKFRRLRDGKALQCALPYFLRMSNPLSSNQETVNDVE